MARPKKEARQLDIAEVERAVTELVKQQELKISFLDFMRLNLQKFKKTGLSRQTIYENLTRKGLNLGSFNVFSGYWSRVEKSGIFISANTPSEANSPVKADVVEEVEEQKQEPERSAEREREVKQEVRPEMKLTEEPKKKTNPALRPIYVNGVEVQVDPATGAKTFEIKSSKKSNDTRKEEGLK